MLSTLGRIYFPIMVCPVQGAAVALAAALITTANIPIIGTALLTFHGRSPIARKIYPHTVLLSDDRLSPLARCSALCAPKRS